MFATAYHRPSTLAEALRLFAERPEPMYLSGGHTLIPTMKNRLASPSDLIDLRGIPDLAGIREDGGRLTIGAATCHADVAASPVVRRLIPALALLAGSIGDVQVRHMGTLGGSVANNDPSADYPAAVLGLGATVVTDRRRVPADDFFAGLYATALEPGEVVVAIEFSAPQGAGYAKYRNPASRYALAAAMVAQTGDGVRVAVTGAGNEGVFRWAEAEAALALRFDTEALEGLRIEPATMLGDMHASGEYRAHLAAVMTRRAVVALNGAHIV